MKVLHVFHLSQARELFRVGIGLGLLVLSQCSLPAADRINVLLLCIDDLRPELQCYGVDYIQSPHIDALAATGRTFTRHFVQAPTCGASRFALLTGLFGGASNEAIFQRAAQIHNGQAVPPSMPDWFRKHGYTTVSVGKVSHHPGGRGGPDWDDDDQPEMPAAWDRHLLPAGAWQHPRGAMHGLAHGEIRDNAKNMDLFQSADGDDSIYPDGLITAEAVHQVELLASDSFSKDSVSKDRVGNHQGKPFFLAVGIIRPHLPFGAPAKYMQHYREVALPPIAHPLKPSGKTTWHNSAEFMKYNRWQRNPIEDAEFATEVRKHYAACVSYADAQVGKIMASLKVNGLAENTVVVLWGDHGWHLGEHAIWGKHALFEESLRSPLIISYPQIKQAGEKTQAVVETLDIFPTLCELTQLPVPEFVAGVSLLPILESPAAPGHPAVSYSNKDRTIRTDQYRMILHADGFVELYDHDSPAGETENLANQLPSVVTQLNQQLRARKP